MCQIPCKNEEALSIRPGQENRQGSVTGEPGGGQRHEENTTECADAGRGRATAAGRCGGRRTAPGTDGGMDAAVARYMLQVAIEAEATAFLGRGQYRRGQRLRVGWRNGYEPKGVQSEAGLLKLQIPQLRSTEERFYPTLVARVGSRSVDLDGLVRGMYVRGLSTQDIEELYGESFGESRLSKTTVSRIAQPLSQHFEAWRKRGLSDLPVVYLCLDGQYQAARQGTDEKEGVLSAYAILEDGRPVLVHLDLGPRESYDAWLSFLRT
jgi:putative transposase